MDKLFLKFPYSWWPESTTGFSFLWSDDDHEQFIKENKVCNYNYGMQIYKHLQS